MSHMYISVTFGRKKFGRRRRPALDAARMQHRRPYNGAAHSLSSERPERGLLSPLRWVWPCALWAMLPVHASSTTTTTTDDLLAVHDDSNSLRSGKQKIHGMALQATGHEQTGVGRTFLSRCH